MDLRSDLFVMGRLIGFVEFARVGPAPALITPTKDTPGTIRSVLALPYGKVRLFFFPN